MKKFFRILFDTAWAPIVFWIASDVLFLFFLMQSGRAAPGTWLDAMPRVLIWLVWVATLVVAVAFVRALLQRCWRRALDLALFAVVVLFLAAVA